MAFPNDILLPLNAKKFGVVDTDYEYNPHWDITWSFSFALTGTEHAFSTFLTSVSSISSAVGGQYLGVLTSESPQPNNYAVIVAFDSTGLFALPISGAAGVGGGEIKPNSLIIRDEDYSVVFNESLSTLSTEFFLASSQKSFQTLRFRYSNSGKKISIDYKTDNTSYTNLTSVNLTTTLSSYSHLYPAFTFCSPISSSSTPSTLFLKNFHVQGNTSEPTYDNVDYTALSVFIPTSYTILSGISANPNY